MLAIIIPYYKLMFFEETLQSLANQTDKRLKVYIGDDASPENPLELLDNYKGKFEYTYHRFEDNLGGISLTKHWERCIALSGDEEWLMILGDDDLLGENVVEEFYKQLPKFKGKTNVVRFASKIIEEDTKKMSDVYLHPIWETAEDSFYRKFEYLTRSSLSEYVFSKASYLKYGFQDYPLGWYSDDNAWFNFSDNKSIFTINDSLIFIRISELNVSGKTDNISDKDVSAIEFYKFIILNKLKFYNKVQRKRLLDKYENTIKKTRKLNLTEWISIFFFYIKYFDWYSLKKVLKRFIKSKLRYDE